MSRLYLIKHSLPEVDPARPSREWTLGRAGRARAEQLAAQLAGAGIVRFVSSSEAKAHATARAMAAALAVPVDVADGLHEQERERAPFFADPADFDAAIRDLFARPGEPVLGDESADQAHARFAAALAGVLEGARLGPLAVVSHGTVMTLFIARQNRLDPFPLWKSLGLPSCAVMSLPDLRLLELIQVPAG